jgi:hypothetical protein
VKSGSAVGGTAIARIERKSGTDARQFFARPVSSREPTAYLQPDDWPIAPSIFALTLDRALSYCESDTWSAKAGLRLVSCHLSSVGRAQLS